MQSSFSSAGCKAIFPASCFFFGTGTAGAGCHPVSSSPGRGGGGAHGAGRSSDSCWDACGECPAPPTGTGVRGPSQSVAGAVGGDGCLIIRRGVELVVVTRPHVHWRADRAKLLAKQRGLAGHLGDAPGGLRHELVKLVHTFAGRPQCARSPAGMCTGMSSERGYRSQCTGRSGPRTGVRIDYS